MKARKEIELLLQTTSDIIIGVSAEYNITEFNRSAELFYNIEASGILDKNFFQLFASHGFHSPIDGHFGEISTKLEKFSETQNGHGKRCTIKWEIHPFHSKNTKTRLFLIGKDASFKKSTIAHNLADIINCTPGSLYWKDKKGRYLGCNQFMVTTSGLKTVNDIIGKTDFDLWPDYAKTLFENDQFVMRSGETLFTEEAVQIPSGKLMYFTGVKMPLRDENNSIIGVIGNSLDITALKLVEQELREAKHEAEKSNQLKTEFIHNMEHDIRTPFNGIYSMVQILEEKETEKGKKEWLSAIARSAKQLLDYCNSILDFSKLETGNIPILTKKFNLRELIDNVIAMEKPAAEAKHLSLLIAYANDTPVFFIGDSYRIQRVLINLISNAIKFTEKGYVKIIAKLVKKFDSKNAIIRIGIEDTGIGIPIEKQNILYEKFNRLTPSNQGFYKGAGLGLSIVKQFINELEGEIELSSGVGVGSVFTCTLPVGLPLIDE